MLRACSYILKVASFALVLAQRRDSHGDIVQDARNNAANARKRAATRREDEHSGTKVEQPEGAEKGGKAKSGETKLAVLMMEVMSVHWRWLMFRRTQNPHKEANGERIEGGRPIPVQAINGEIHRKQRGGNYSVRAIHGDVVLLMCNY